MLSACFQYNDFSSILQKDHVYPFCSRLKWDKIIYYIWHEYSYYKFFSKKKMKHLPLSKHKKLEGVLLISPIYQAYKNITMWWLKLPFNFVFDIDLLCSMYWSITSMVSFLVCFDVTWSWTCESKLK